MARDAVAEVRDRTEIVDLVSNYVQLKKTGRILQGSLPVPSGKDALVRRLPRVRQLPLLRLRPRRRRLHLLHGRRARRVPRGPARARQARRRRARQRPEPAAGGRRPPQPAHRAQRAGRRPSTPTSCATPPPGAAGRACARAARRLSRDRRAFRPRASPPTATRSAATSSQRGVDPALAVEAGLLSERDSGGYRDRFRNRLLFPIRTREGRVVGFGGRALGDAHAEVPQLRPIARSSTRAPSSTDSTWLRRPSAGTIRSSSSRATWTRSPPISSVTPTSSPRWAPPSPSSRSGSSSGSAATSSSPSTPTRPVRAPPSAPWRCFPGRSTRS